MTSRSIEYKNKARKKLPETRKFFQRLKKNSPKNIDLIVQSLHEEVFNKLNCLECANCCKILGPLLTDKDIARIATALKIRPSEFTSKLLFLDEDGDYVFKSMPCPFIAEDNYCTIYDIRPKACREYPHTEQPGFIKRLQLMEKNYLFCPAIYEIIEKLKQK